MSACQKTWFEWRETTDNLLRRMTIRWKVVSWIWYLLHKASEVRGNEVRRWKARDHRAVYFCTKKFSAFGRFVSIVAVHGSKRSVIFIIPESAFNAGWDKPADKIENYIQIKTRLQQSHLPNNWILRMLKALTEKMDSEIWHFLNGGTP